MYKRFKNIFVKWSRRKKAELDAFFMPDLEEKEKLIRYLDMIFDETSHKQIFYDRWSSKVGVCDYKSRTFGRQQKYKKQTKKENNERKKDSTAIFEKSSLSLPKVNANLHSVVDDNKEEEIDERGER